MPGKSGRLTAQERVYVDVSATTGDNILAAKVAGYSDPYVAAHRGRKNPAILAEIQRVQTEALVKLADVAIGTLSSIMTNDHAPAGARVQAAKLVLDKAGIGVRDTADAKQPYEMTGSELADAITRLTHEIAERKRPQIEAQAVEVADDTPSNTSIFE